MYLKLNNKFYEIENEKMEELLTEMIVLKIDEVFDGFGMMSSTIKSSLNSLLLMQGFKKEAGSDSLIESALIEMIASVIEAEKDRVIEFDLKEVNEEDVEKLQTD